MEPNDKEEQSTTSAAISSDFPVITPSQSDVMAIPPVKDTPCPTCGPGAASMPASYVYALGRIEARFPKLSVEKEFAQVKRQAAIEKKTDKKADQEVFHAVLSDPEHRYLARQMCWVFTVQGLETYILLPRDPADISQLVGTVRPVYSLNDMDLVIGLRGPIAPPGLCNGLIVPIVMFDQLYSFDRDKFIEDIPRPGNIDVKDFGSAASELFARIMQMTDNAGATDEHRALNYLSVRYSDIYAKTAEEFGNDFSLTRVDVLPSALSSTRKIVKVVFSYTNRKTDFTEKFFVRVDVTEEFPFLVTKISPYFDR